MIENGVNPEALAVSLALVLFTEYPIRALVSLKGVAVCLSAEKNTERREGAAH